MRRVPRQTLHADFVRAVRASGHSLVTLAALANFAAFTQLSSVLSRRVVRVSTLNVDRLRGLAAVVTYDGPIFSLTADRPRGNEGAVAMKPRPNGRLVSLANAAQELGHTLYELVQNGHLQMVKLPGMLARSIWIVATSTPRFGRYVFHRPQTPNIRIKQLRKPWGTACKKAGCPGRLFHDLRRSAARNFVRSGIPERVAMRLLGHKTRSIFDRYNIVSSGDLLDAARRLDASAVGTQL